MRRLSLLLLACLTLGIAWAERVSVNTAQQVAANVAAGLSPSNLRSSSDLKLVYAAPAKQQSGLRAAGNESDCYIFNVGTGDGFIIVAGEDRVRPVLGYSAEGEVDMEKMPGNMKAWLEMYQKEISWAVAQNISASDAIQKEWQEWLSGSKSMANQGVLLETAKWGQGEPYNKLTPIFADEHAVTGCVATAQAIVMYYYRDYLQTPFVTSTKNSYTITINDAIPTSTPNSYKIEERSTEQKSIFLEYKGYDWNNMLPEYVAGNYTPEQAEAVAELMWHCGVNAEMNYAITYFPNGIEPNYSSGATTAKISSSLKNVFGFAPSARYVVKDNYHWDEWEKLISQELYASRPVILNGTDPRQGGHAFVCDGYKPDGMVHINWGWNGFHNDGYFLLTTLDDDGDGNGFAASGYGAIIGIHPTEGEAVEAAPPYISIMQYEGGFPLSEKGTVSIAYRLTNLNEQAIDYYVALAIVDENNLDNIPTPTNRQVHFSFNANQSSYYSDATSTININVPLADNQRVSFVYSTDGENWKLLPSAVNLPIGLKENGEVYEEEEMPTSTVEWLSNPFDGQYMQLIQSFTANNKPIQIKLNDWTEGESATIELSLKNPAWADALTIAYDLEKPVEGNGSNLVFYEGGKATIQVGSHMIKEGGLIDIYMRWNAKEFISETIEYDLRAFDATPTSPTYTMTVLEKPLTWVYNEDFISGAHNQILPFTIKATNVPSFANNQNVSMRLFIEAVSLGEVEVYYENDEGKRTKLNIIDNPELDEGFLLTEDFTINLVEGKEYKFVYCYIGERGSAATTLYVDAVNQDGAEIPVFNAKEDGTLGCIVFEISPSTIIVTDGEPLTYYEGHKYSNVIVQSGATYIIPADATDATIANLSVYDGGQIEAHQPLTVTGSTMVFLDIPTGKWRTLTMPLDTWMREDASGIYLKTGFRFVDEQEWKLETPNSATGQYAVSQGSVHLAASDPAKEDVIFEWAAQNTPYTVEVPKKNTAVYGNEENGNWFRFVANPNWQNLMVNGRAYVLNDAGNSFELQQSPVIPPFQAYMIASESVMKQVSSLRIGDIPTSNEDLAVTGFRVWSESGHVCFETTEAKDVAVYSMNGVQQCRFERSVGVHRQQLPQGIYIVVCDGTAYKVSVK